MWQPWVNIVAGIWAIISGIVPFLAMTNFLITGIVMAIFGFWRPDHLWQGLVDGILGLWLVLSAFVPSMQTAANFLVVGLVVTALTVWRAMSARRVYHEAHPQPH